MIFRIFMIIKHNLKALCKKQLWFKDGKSLICSLSVFLFFPFCTIHNLKINGNPAVKYKNPLQAEKKNLDLDRIIPDNKKSDNFENLIQSYNSDSMNKKFNKGCCITINKNANYILRYSTEINEEMPFPISPIFFLLTLGISPVVEVADANVKFQIVEKNTDKVKQEYLYQISHVYITSWLSMISSLFLWGDHWDLAMFHSHEFPQDMIISQFEKDFLHDLSNQKVNFIPASTGAKISGKGRYAILPVTYSHSKDKETSDVIRDKVETVLVNKNYTVLERSKLNEIIKEFRLAQTGLTRNDQIELGKMLNANNLVLIEILELNKSDNQLEFSVKNLDVESGQILWKYEFLIDESKISSSINKAMSELETKIK